MSKKNTEDTEAIVDVQEVYSKTETFIEDNKKKTFNYCFSYCSDSWWIFSYKKLIIAPMELEAQEEMFMAEKYFELDSLNLAINGDGKHFGFVDIIDQYSGTKAANLSHYYLGLCYRGIGDYDMAIEELESFSSDDVMVSAVAIGAIGDCLMELNDVQGAVSKYEKAAATNENNLTSPIYLFKAGLALEDLNDFAGAVEKYNTIKSDFPDSREAQTIDKYLARAEAYIK